MLDATPDRMERYGYLFLERFAKYDFHSYIDGSDGVSVLHEKASHEAVEALCGLPNLLAIRPQGK